jgi:Fic family protein
MDRRKFSASSPGELIQIEANEVAFVPHPLPPKEWEFPNRLWPLLSEAKSYVGELAGIGSVLPNPTILLRPIADREALQSSRLEGTYATARELLLFELQPLGGVETADRVQDHREVYNYQRALQHGIDGQLPLSLRLIRELHGILLAGVRGRDRTPGEFRRVQVAMGVSQRFVPPPPNHLNACLHPLEDYFHKADDGCDPLVSCFLAHYQFETIHPFVDGNGRVGRLLLAMMLQQRCRLTKPWLYLSEFFERNREEYVQRMFDVSAEAKWSEWIEFCLTGTLTHAKSTISLCRRLLKVRDEYSRRITDVGGTIRLSQIVEGIFSSPFVQVAALAKQLGVSYPTAKADIQKLVDAKILRALPDVPTKTFYAPEVFDIAYADVDTGTPAASTENGQTETLPTSDSPVG